MSSRCLEPRALPVAALLVVLATPSIGGCEREMRRFDPPQTAASAPAQRMTDLQPGVPAAPAASGAATIPSTAYSDETNAYAVAQGKRLYRWFNCSGCHAPGGGGDWGPALTDDRWIYGSSAEDIFMSIAQGRPAGMPSFGSHLSEDQIWQLVGYVRSMSGQLRTDVAPGRSDGMSGHPPEARRSREQPRPMVIDDGTRR
jgi:cytochrome c oxidase cbb3-type subunit 3